MKLLIVCLGNTCRSPIAGGLARKMAAKRAMDIEVRTAGITHHPGRPVEPKAVAVMTEIGADISYEYSKPLTAEDISWADWVLCLQRKHALYLADQHPAARQKLLTLGADVQDPFHKPVSEYRKCRDQLEALLQSLPIWGERSL